VKNETNSDGFWRKAIKLWQDAQQASSKAFLPSVEYVGASYGREGDKECLL